MKYTIFLLFFGLIMNHYLKGQVKSMVADNLEEDFAELIKEDFIVHSQTIKPDKHGEDYLLFKITPVKPGFYRITHTFLIKGSNTKDEYGMDVKNTNYKIEYFLSIHENPQKSFYTYDGIHNWTLAPVSHNCLNDTIIIPLIINKNAINQNLTLRKFENAGWDDPGDQIMDLEILDIEVQNNVEELEFLNIRKSWSTQMHSINKGTHGTATLYAVFRAKKTGIFNLNIKNRKIPIQIIPNSSSIKTIYGIDIEESSEYKNGGKTISGSNKIFPTSKVYLRTGDVISIELMTYDERYQSDTKKHDILKINKSKFSITNDKYDYWLDE